MMHMGDILSRVGISCIHQSTMVYVGEYHECIRGILLGTFLGV